MTAPAPHDRSDVGRWRRFRAARDAALAEPHGWLSLTSFQWLREEPSRVDLVTGLWSVVGDAASVTATPDDGLTDLETGDRLDGTLTARLQNEESLLWVAHGGTDGRRTAVELARRSDRYAIRTRDAESPVLTSFRGVPVFDLAPEYVVDGRFEPYDAPRVDPVRTAHPEVTGEQISAGDVVLRLPGEDREHRLSAVQEENGTLGITFHDTTNGHTTAGWRRVTAERPNPDGTVVVDFNRAVNYPSAFSPFGTCPMPVGGNTIDRAVEAGERAPSSVRT